MSEQAQVPATTPPPAQPPVQVPGLPYTYVTSEPPLGRPMAMDGMQLAELGAILNAAGMEKNAVASLFTHLQKGAIDVFLMLLPTILGDVQKIQRLRLDRIMQEIRQLPAAVVQQGILSRIANPNVPTVTYVRMDEVLNIVAMALREAPTAS